MRLFPEDDQRQVIHVLEPGSTIGITGEQIKISRRVKPAAVQKGTALAPETPPVEKIPARQVGQIVLHSFSQISTQALHFCADQEIGVHFVSGGGHYLGSFDARRGSIQRRVRQYAALSSPETCLNLAKKLVLCRAQGQRKFLMRGQRSKPTERLSKTIAQMKAVLKQTIYLCLLCCT